MDTVLFVCRGNVGRSQMAEALYRKYSGLRAISAGTKVPQEGPGKEGKMLKDIPVAEPVIRCLKEDEGIDVSNQRNKSLTPEMLERADRVVVMAEKETIPDYLRNNEKTIIWTIEDPLRKSYEEYCKKMEEIKTLVLKFIEQEKASPERE